MRFEEEEKIIIISEEDKQQIRFNIFEAFLSNKNKLIRKQFSECIKKISKFELGNKFSFVIDNIIHCFQSQEDNKIFAGIIIFYNISKLYAYETGEYKQPYVDAFAKLHDYLMNFILGLIDKFENSEACFIIYKIIKIYSLSTQTELNDLLVNPVNLEKWYSVVLFVLQKKYSGDLIKKSNDSQEIKILEKNIFWKIKHTCMKIFNLSYYKYSHKLKSKDSKIKEYSNLITNVYAEKFCEAYLNILYSTKDEFLPDAMGGILYKFFADLISKNHLVKTIEENLEHILKEYIVKSAFMKSEDIELWKDDVKSYIMKQFDVADFYDTEREGVVKFLVELCKYKKKVNKKKEKFPCYFENIFKFLVSILETFENQTKSGNNPDYRIKEATLFLIENLESPILK